MAYGVQPSGFVAKPFEVIKQELEDDFRATFGEGINVLPDSVFGHLIGIFADRLADLWQLAEGVYAATTPDGAGGVSLDLVSALTGTLRATPEKTHVIARCFGTDGTVLAPGRRARIPGGATFESLHEATIGPSGFVDVEFQALEAGEIPCYAGTLTEIVTPAAGWSGVTNPNDHTHLGRGLESDEELRIRRESELRARGMASLPAINERLRALNGVADVLVFENVTDTVDGDGIPPHSIEAVVDGGDDAEVAAAIFGAKSGGIQAHGSTVETVTDSSGNDHAIGFTRPTERPIWVHVTIPLVDPDLLPADAEDQIKQVIADYADRVLTMGSDVIASALGAQAFKVSGVLDVPPPLIGPSSPPHSTATIPIAPREKAIVDTSRITVTLP